MSDPLELPAEQGGEPAEEAGIALAENAPPEEVPPVLPFYVVGIGASAGGIEAYIALFGHLPADTGMAFVVISHLARDQKSRLGEILARHTAMPVSDLGGNIAPEPNHVYVLPPNSFVTISRGILVLEPRPAGAQVPLPIDHFFRSLAADQKTRAIGVVLSGMDSDGAVGLKTIKGLGGLSIVQEPDSARFPSMPRRSIEADHVDLIVPPERIGKELKRISEQSLNPELSKLEEPGDTVNEGDEAALRQIFALLRGVPGPDFADYKAGTIRRRIARRIILLRLDSLNEYVDWLGTHSGEIQALHEDLLINVTQFFRDSEVFDKLRHVILPKLFGAGRAPDQQVRIWVAGCSTGEEVYSIAICLLEYLSEAFREMPSIQIFGTDASDASVRKARAGLYPESLAHEISPERLQRFFIKVEKGYQVAKCLREICIFARQNLSADPPYSRLDLVSCRNVLIYLNQRLQGHIIGTFHYSLRPSGYLLLGKAETIRAYDDLFTAVDRADKFYAKIPGGERSGFETWQRTPRGMPAITSHGADPRVYLTEADLQRAVDRIILSRLSLPGIVVDEHLNIVFTRGHTTPFLSMAAGTPSLQLMRMLRDDLSRDVRQAVQKAIEDDIPVHPEPIRVLDPDHVWDLEFEVLPLQEGSRDPRYFLILFSVPRDPRPMRRPVQPDERERISPGEQEDLVAQLRRDLAATREHMRSLVEDRDARNQELTSASEEIQSQNEELQSTNEELETTKEEIQSANEELQTINDEVQNRNVTLAQVGDDLVNLLSSVNLPVLMLNNEMQIRRFTPATERVMSLRASDIGRPLREIRVQLSVDDLEPIVQEVLHTLVTREVEVQDREKRWHLLRVRPYRTTENKIDGVVLLLIDIDDSRRALDELREARDYSRVMLDSVQVPIVVLDLNLKIRTANIAFRALTNGTPELVDRSFPDLAIALWDMRKIVPCLEKLRDEEDGARFQLTHEASRTGTVLSVNGLALRVEGKRVLLLAIHDITVIRRAERLLTEQRNSLQGQVDSGAIELERTHNELRGLATQLFTSQEEERRHVARELHDDITQKLALLNMNLEQFAKEVPGDEVRRRLNTLLEQTSDLVDDVRQISYRLHPAILDDLGLPLALKALTEEFGAREGMPATFQEGELPAPVPHEVAASLYRIAQEALRNVAKHAGKTHVKVSLEETSDGIQMEVVDFGAGFAAGDSRGGIGLVSMVERARIVSGTVAIRSQMGKGTSIRVTIPR